MKYLAEKPNGLNVMKSSYKLKNNIENVYGYLQNIHIFCKYTYTRL